MPSSLRLLQSSSVSNVTFSGPPHLGSNETLQGPDNSATLVATGKFRELVGEATAWDMGTPCSPSPLPYPSGRGSSNFRFLAIPDALLSPTVGRGGAVCLGERAGVRGKETSELERASGCAIACCPAVFALPTDFLKRSEERRVGKEWRSR